LSRAATILRNVVSNWVGFAVNAAVTLLLTPFVVRHLGPAGYGIWILSSSVVGYYGFLDLGFRAGVTQYLIRYLANGDMDHASECMSSSVAALAVLGAFMVTLSVGAAYVVPRVFHLPVELVNDAFWCILIVGVSSGLQFALSPFTSIFAATQRFDLANLIGVLTRLLTSAGTVIVLRSGYGLIGVSAATCTVSLVDYGLRWFVARRLAPQIELSRRKVRFARLKEIGVFGAWNFLISLNAFIYQHVPNMLIGAFMPIVAVGRYALSVGLVRQITASLGPVGQVIYPAAAALHAMGDISGRERLYHDGSRLMMLVMIPAAMLAFFWAEDFYRVWVGEAYLSGSTYPSVALVFQILVLSTVTNFSNIAGQILMGAGRVRIVAIASICGSAINLSLSVVLIRYYGLIGVAIAVVVASVLVDFAAMPWLAQRYLGLSVKNFVRRACVRPLAVALLQLVAVICVRLMGRPVGWIELILQGSLAAALCAIIVLAVGITSSERQRFVTRPLWRLAGRNLARV
jgi:O-antigen/teichoic acid export membrane protein